MGLRGEPRRRPAPRREAAAESAVAIAKATRPLLKRPVELAPRAGRRRRGRRRWQGSVRGPARGQGRVPARDLAAREGRAGREVRDRRRSRRRGEWKLFASTDGSLVEQTHHARRAGASRSPRSTKRAVRVARSTSSPPHAGRLGVRRASRRSRGRARSIAEDAVEKLKAPSVTPGKRDLDPRADQPVADDPRVGRPPDRARSRARLRGELRRHVVRDARQARQARDTARRLVTFYADKTTPGGLATCGYDDDGVATQTLEPRRRTACFVGYQTTREQAGWIGEKASRGTCYAQTYASFPFQRMPNVSLAPGAKETLARRHHRGDRRRHPRSPATARGRSITSATTSSSAGQTFYEIKKRQDHARRCATSRTSRTRSSSGTRAT